MNTGKVHTVEFSTRKVRTYWLFLVVFLTLAVFVVFVLNMVLPIPPTLAHNPVQFSKSADFHVVLRLIVRLYIHLVSCPQLCLPFR
jgi:hypothetical protein